MFLVEFWNNFLYRPLFNFLIWMYNNWTHGNLGWAVVYLTVFLRLALLPFTVLAERAKVKNEIYFTKVKQMIKEYKKDPVLLKQEVRKYLKKKKVRPWSRVFEIGVQLVVLLLLYQVFLRGITGERVKILRLLYDFVNYPGDINTMFYSFDLGAIHDSIWAGFVAVFMLFYIFLEFKENKVLLTKRDLAYFTLFPLSVFLLLWILPMVKSLFILTSMIMSVVFHYVIKLFIRKPKLHEKAKST